MSDVTVIGRDTFIRGNVRGEGDLEIHGRVEGEIEIAGAVTVAAGALVKADIAAREIVVGGSLAGNLTADEALRLEEGARVVGDLRAPTIGISEGALFRGNVETNVSEEAVAVERERSATRPERSVAPAARPAAAPVAMARPVERPAPAPARPAVSEKPAPARVEPSRPVATRIVPVTPSARPPVERRPAPASATPSQTAPAASAAPAPAAISVPDSAAPASTPAPPIEESAPESEERAAPPPPVVPALRKGAKGAIKKKAR